MTDGIKRGPDPRRSFVCPECRVSFVANNELNGKRCPNGHWHSVYHLKYFEANGKLPVRQDKVKAAPPPVALPLAVSPVSAMRDLGFKRHAEQCELALQWWIGAYERLLGQLPASTSKLLIYGAFDQSYRVSKQLVG